MDVSVLEEHFIVPVLIKRTGRDDVIRCVDVSVLGITSLYLWLLKEQAEPI